MGLILALLMASIPVECRIARIDFKAKRTIEPCATEGSIAFKARYFTRAGARIHADECGVDPPTWGADRFMDLDETGFRATLQGVKVGDEPVVGIAVTQGAKSFYFERAVK